MNRFAVIFLAIYLSTASLVAQQIRVACVGSNLTYGTGMEKREVNSYPMQLQRLLGSAYLVKNFGAEGSTALLNSENAYSKTDEYKASIDFEPEIIIINFGTVEAISEGNTDPDKFESGLEFFVQKYFNLPTAIRIILLTPTALGPAASEGSTKDMEENIFPAVQKVAYQTSSEVLDMYSLLKNNPENFSDDVNVSATGAAVISRNIYTILDMRTEHDFNFVLSMGIEGVSYNYYGFNMNEFELYGWTCTIVSPKRTAIGRPWVWKSLNFYENPELDLQMLQRGYHIVHIENEGLYGNEMAMDRFNRLYDLIVQGGMSREPVMIGIKDGAIPLFKWAAQHHDKLSCIYAEDPVMDLYSWPAGEGKSKGDNDAWKDLRKAYDIRSDRKLEQWSGESPVDMTESWFGANVPMLIIADKTNNEIPYEENGGKFFDKVTMKKDPQIILHDGEYEMDLIEKAGFLITYSGNKTNLAIVAASGTESRSVKAGWKPGADWWDNHREINERVSVLKPDILFLGDEITQGIGGGRTLLTRTPGEIAFEQFFNDYTWENGGIAGDKTQQLTFRITDGGYIRAGIRLVVVTCGVNNFEEDSADEIARGIATVVRVVERQMPDSKIIITGPLPVGKTEDDPMRIKYDQIHDKLQKVTWGDFVTYRRILNEFYDSSGNLKEDLYRDNYIHLTPEGYRAWAEWLRIHVDQVLDR